MENALVRGSVLIDFPFLISHFSFFIWPIFCDLEVKAVGWKAFQSVGKASKSVGNAPSTLVSR